MMVGYHSQGLEEAYRFYNIETARICTSCDVKWLNETYGEYKMRKEKRKDNADDEESSIIINPSKTEVKPQRNHSIRSPKKSNIQPSVQSTLETPIQTPVKDIEISIAKQYPIPRLSSEVNYIKK